MQEYTKKSIEFIKAYFDSTAHGQFAVVGISGGKDSACVAALCVEALGSDKVLGVILPNKEMQDKEDAEKICDLLKIHNITVDISASYKHFTYEINRRLRGLGKEITEDGRINIAPRLRMTSLYAISSSINGLVACTLNLSERIVGYCTKWGDNVGDFAPIMHLTKEQVILVGLDLGLPEQIMKKAPNDGISGHTDEENLGVTYDDIEKYIKGQGLDLKVMKKIESLIKRNAHKNKAIPSLLNFQVIENKNCKKE